ncbi:myosin-11 [Rhypophila decipiens]|uniref:Myosin-11 n=1 Tax=Rhypophila decipiens TaxID=261697 RepID=A0AAN6YDL2_9PEZI|nr:myosin-11 [Rhypophila decipiens]
MSETTGTTTEMRCCCGKEECVFLRHNCSVLLSVERDVHVAAKMGQTLLARHEAYMASAERDRLELTARIEQLEHENSELETKNKLVTDENHSLRDELEGLNETVKDADTRIEALEATLRDSQRQVRRLEGAAERAANLERQIALLEEEQQTLQNTLLGTREEARSAMKRWKEAQRGLIETQEQLERMEKESREERERHVEVLGRIERQRQMEKELNTAAGRLKGAAGVKSMTDSKNGHNVVSHFVRDLLQDNANLQLGMAELREMLINSNDEIQMLREQLVYHQPVSQGGEHEASSTSTLRAELQQKEPLSPSPPRVQQQFHIHHHYHVTHRPEQRKPKKRRQILTAGTFSPPPQPSYASSPAPSQNHWQVSRGLGAPFPGHAPKGSTSSISITPYGRWSIMSDNPSEFAPSSAPSSPPSANRSSMFDRSVVEIADPTSPITSIDPLSPVWRGSHRKQGSELSTQSISSAMFQLNPGQAYGPPTQVHDSASQLHSPYTTDDLPEPSRNMRFADNTTTDTMSTDADTNNTLLSRSLAPGQDYFDARVEQRPQRLRRVISHESIMSLSNGMDIHTLKARPSQLTLRPLGVTAAGTNISDVTAVPTIARSSSNGRRTSVILRDNLTMAGLAAASARGREPNRSVSSPLQTRSSSRQSSSSALGKLVAWRPWGGSSTRSDTSPSPSPLASPTATAATTSPTAIPTTLLSPAVASVSKSAHVSPQGSLSSFGTFRAPGINQPGSIPGFQEYWAQHKRRGAPSKVTADNLEQIQEAMREVLEEG